jgi:hypothetical protein
MALGDPYATVPQMKERLTLEDDDTVEDTQLLRALKSASRGINHFCGRQFNDKGSASARVYRPGREDLLKLDDFHSLDGLVIKTDDGDSGTYGTTWTEADYELEPLNGVVNGEEGWPWWRIRAVGSRRLRCGRRASVQVTARWGWESVPDDVNESCLVSAVEIFKLKDTPFGVGGYSEFGIVKVRDNPFVARMLTPYQRDPWLAA